MATLSSEAQARLHVRSDVSPGREWGDQPGWGVDRAEIRFTGHSARSGLATEARRAGHDAATIARQGGWKENSRVLYGYMQVVDRWADNPVAGIGL